MLLASRPRHRAFVSFTLSPTYPFTYVLAVYPFSEQVTHAIPELRGRLLGMGYNVQAANVSAVDFTCRLCTPASLELIGQAIRAAAAGELAGARASAN